VTVVVKAGGSGLFVRVPYEPRVPWDWYRHYRINEEYFSKLVAGLAHAANQSPLLFVPGGVGAYLYIGLSQRLGLHDEAVNQIGCDIVNVTGRIIMQSLLTQGVEVYPSLANLRDNLGELIRQYQVLVMAASLSFRSTDAVAAAAAVKVGATRLMLFKQGVPTFHLGFESPTVMRSISISRLQEMIGLSEEGPGRNAILDSQAVAIIANGGVETVLYEAGEVERLSEILIRRHWPLSTRITFPATKA
jgi:uridylate kinase